MATNDLGRQLAASINAPTTLGSYRWGNWIPWLPGATYDAWVPCARGEIATGVSSPHVYFVQTIGDRGGGSIYCPACREEVAARRVVGTPMTSLPKSSSPAASRPAAPQSTLPF